MPRIFVTCSNPTGGAYVAYHVGLIAKEVFGLDFYTVSHNGATPDRNSIYNYEFFPKGITPKELISIVTPEDIAIINSSWSSMWLGHQLKCKKVMYVQGITTFRYLDCDYEEYISASSVIQRFLSAVYGLNSQIITPFYKPRELPQITPWHERPENSVFIYMKTKHQDLQLFANHMLQYINESVLGIQLKPTLYGRQLNRREFLSELGRHRYFLNLTPLEGFGLVALEAMAMEVAVVGLDAIAGQDYMRTGYNCLTYPQSKIFNHLDDISDILKNDDEAHQLATRAKESISDFTYKRFKETWTIKLQEILNR